MNYASESSFVFVINSNLSSNLNDAVEWLCSSIDSGFVTFVCAFTLIFLWVFP